MSQYFKVECVDEASVPVRKTSGSAGYDLVAPDDFIVPRGTTTIPVRFDLKLRILIPPGMVGVIQPRSSQAAKGIDIRGGIIDSDYAGSIQLLLLNYMDADYVIKKGDRIAQMLVLAHAKEPFERVQDYHERRREADAGQEEKEERGSGGFGSTGV